MINIVISPIITEKSMKAAEGGRYSFLVSRLASKAAIKQAVAGMFKVNVVNIYTSVAKGKRKRIGTRRIEVADSEAKKAIVQLKKGEKIGIFELGGAEDEGARPRSEKKKNEKEDKKEKKAEKKKS